LQELEETEWEQTALRTAMQI